MNESQKPELLQLKTIRIDGGTQSRVRIDPKIVTEYAELMECGTIFPPVVVFFDGVNHWLVDGFHRYSASRQIGRESILADVHNGSQRDAILFSLEANATHGLRRSNEDKKKTILTMLLDEEWSQWSNREIAKRCGLSEFMVRQMRSNHTAIKSQYENSDRTFVHPKTGKPTQMNTDNIGAKSKSNDNLTLAPVTLVSTDPNLTAHDIVMSMGKDYAMSLATAIRTYLEITAPLSGKSFN